MREGLWPWGKWHLLGTWLLHQLSVVLGEDPGISVTSSENGDRQRHLLEADRWWALGKMREREREGI